MSDIYHQVIKHSPDFERFSDDDLVTASDTYGSGAYAITSVLTLIGNLTVDALYAEGYTDKYARRDLDLIGTALRHLPGMAQAFEQNHDTAHFVLRKRRGEASHND